MVGYFAAQSNSYYIGNLMSIKYVNTREIKDVETIIKLIGGTN